jgi:hypothetical protein
MIIVLNQNINFEDPYIARATMFPDFSVLSNLASTVEMSAVGLGFPVALSSYWEAGEMLNKYRIDSSSSWSAAVPNN